MRAAFAAFVELPAEEWERLTRLVRVVEVPRYDGLLNAAFFERHVITMELASARAWARREPPTKR